jgi:hypothetical protein
VAALPGAPASALPTDLKGLMGRSFDARFHVDTLSSAMREHGPTALKRLQELEPTSTELERHARWRQLMDAVAAQRDASVSHLFWYTDRAQASAAAREAGKPVLSLRLLGRLTDERSCANSRMFRALLYADPDVGNLLRESFVLHWESERAVPQATIRFEDGRVLETTVAGNSIHYVTDPEFRVLDALPGLYAPNDFVHSLQAVLDLHEGTRDATPEQRASVNAAYHEQSISSAVTQLKNTQATLAGKDEAAVRLALINLPRQLDAAKRPEAPVAVRLAITKAAVEFPIVDSIDGTPQWLQNGSTELWRNFRPRVFPRVVLFSEPTRKLIASHTGASGDELQTLIRRLQAGVIEDSQRNEQLLHPTIHQWLSERPLSLDELNERVYRDLFLTPKDDPTLGIVKPDVYSGLPRSGLTVSN